MQQYAGVSSQFETVEKSFDVAVNNATSSGDYSQLAIFANTEAASLQYFDESVQQFTFPETARADVSAMLNADHTLTADVVLLIQGRASANMAWVALWSTRTAAGHQYHVSVANDLGLPSSTVTSAV